MTRFEDWIPFLEAVLLVVKWGTIFVIVALTGWFLRLAFLAITQWGENEDENQHDDKTGVQV